MGWNDRLDDGSEISNLPGEAFSPFGGPFDPQDHWLRTADRDDQMIAMRAWFLARYCHPAHEMPYDSREGGYQFVARGPYDPADVLRERFSSIAAEDAIQEVIDEMHAEVGEDWAPLRDENPDDYDDDYGVIVEESSEPLRRLRGRLAQSQEILTLEGSVSAKFLAQNLAFSSAITALESFLWETVVYWVDHDEAIIIRIVTKIQVFRDQPLKLGEIFRKRDTLKDDIKGYLQTIVWHQWKHVEPLFRLGLMLEVPSFKQFEAPLIKRHDIVHRSGFTKAGEPITVDAIEIRLLCERIMKFATDINEQLAKRENAPF